MKAPGSILVVDDNQDILIAAKLLLKKHYDIIKTTDSPFEIESYIKQFNPDVIILDMNYSQDSVSGKEGFFWLNKILNINPHIVVIMMTAYSDIKLAVDAIKAGATDFIAKPWQNDQLLAAIAVAFNHVKTKNEVAQLTQKNQELNQVLQGHEHAFIGQSKAMQAVFQTIEKAAKTDANILILGESGTGKELAARAIHQASLRAKNPFISLDMGSVPASVFESELFGHKKGAFTDAKTDRLGRFELAHSGSLFLDELANLPLNQQTSLLAALQNRQVTPIGSSKVVDVDIRLICATNDDLHQAVEEGRFRQDLLFRINTVTVHLPALRERKEDIPLLVNYYLEYYGNKYKRSLSISKEHMNSLSHYDWPGNVRELAHTIERAIILTEGESLDISSVMNISKPKSITHDIVEFNLETVEHNTIRAALKHFQGNVSHAAKALGLTRGALYRRLDKYGL
ncbi:sigma-54-dependent transcriptional regulator [Pseudoalteromonas denitrificans]|jgi:DNA-binding NtrC family response regulator|uniref:DNA-binding transcriptional response regulator, NtrC family, contains REC, AAA-type ATPase, and a Fis-type DNA-binding domains n=1 Tax=Pseudoalteromonas denitrificans DSM 6059 TaxID=1123010 RepID=A0A1I1JHN1_9GAMM|nr:sigma-54 dependent transcriptional regulator [Pseudoalteromonas denitrificans]SFC48054.1 DNA-binding transcriptional response regulator, NtrC family, contains REC, AAA-type ATPase, and a Fis-type DNA-binding domains [Pseudoalteromonas denitrificans DSM 6059]